MCLHLPADGLISYSAPEGQLMMPPSSPIACLNDSTYDGVHERRRVKRSLFTTSLFHAGCVWLLSSHAGGCLGGWASWRTAWSAWTTFWRPVSTTCGRATTIWAGRMTRWALRDTWKWNLFLTGSVTSPPWRCGHLFGFTSADQSSICWGVSIKNCYGEHSKTFASPGSQ